MNRPSREFVAYACPLLGRPVTVTVAVDSVMDFTKGGADTYARVRQIEACTGVRFCHSDLADSTGTPCPYRAILNTAGTR
jgi:hypothetical protein